MRKAATTARCPVDLESEEAWLRDAADTAWSACSSLSGNTLYQVVTLTRDRAVERLRRHTRVDRARGAVVDVPVGAGAPPSRDDVRRAAFGLQAWAGWDPVEALAWAVAGTSRPAADRFRAAHVWHPTTHDDLPPSTTGITDLEHAFAWAAWKLPGDEDPHERWRLTDAVLDDLVTSTLPGTRLRTPGSLQAWGDGDGGFTRTDARDLHRLLADSRFLSAEEPTLPFALDWRFYGRTAAELRRWLARPMAPADAAAVASTPAGIAAAWHSELREAGCPDAAAAGPWLAAATRYEDITPLVLAAAYDEGTPADWAVLHASTQVGSA
ncbi:hypothetical protein [Geodermatophilus sp. SYSU D00815]